VILRGERHEDGLYLVVQPEVLHDLVLEAHNVRVPRRGDAEV